MSSGHIAKVVVSAAVYSIDKPYDYKIPESMWEILCPGMRVLVPFGRGNRKTEALVLSISEKSDYSKVKSIETLLDTEPVLSKEQLKLALWMRDRFFCTVYDAVHAMLPVGMWYKDGKSPIGDKTMKFASLTVSGEEALELSERKHMKAPKQAEVLKLLAQIRACGNFYRCGFPDDYCPEKAGVSCC